jgi:hypothetical protein
MQGIMQHLYISYRCCIISCNVYPDKVWEKDARVMEKTDNPQHIHNTFVAQLVQALRYKPNGSGLDSRWCHWDFLLT